MSDTVAPPPPARLAKSASVRHGPSGPSNPPLRSQIGQNTSPASTISRTASLSASASRGLVPIKLTPKESAVILDIVQKELKSGAPLKPSVKRGISRELLDEILDEVEDEDPRAVGLRTPEPARTRQFREDRDLEPIVFVSTPPPAHHQRFGSLSSSIRSQQSVRPGGASVSGFDAPVAPASFGVGVGAADQAMRPAPTVGVGAAPLAATGAAPLSGIPSTGIGMGPTGGANRGSVPPAVSTSIDAIASRHHAAQDSDSDDSEEGGHGQRRRTAHPVSGIAGIGSLPGIAATNGLQPGLQPIPPSINANGVPKSVPRQPYLNRAPSPMPPQPQPREYVYGNIGRGATESVALGPPPPSEPETQDHSTQWASQRAPTEDEVSTTDRTDPPPVLPIYIPAEGELASPDDELPRSWYTPAPKKRRPRPGDYVTYSNVENDAQPNPSGPPPNPLPQPPFPFQIDPATGLAIVPADQAGPIFFAPPPFLPMMEPPVVEFAPEMSPGGFSSSWRPTFTMTKHVRDIQPNPIPNPPIGYEPAPLDMMLERPQPHPIQDHPLKPIYRQPSATEPMTIDPGLDSYLRKGQVQKPYFTRREKRGCLCLPSWR